MRVFAISGSLRAASINSALLRAAKRLAPTDIDLQLFNGLGDLPLFNPDAESDPPVVVQSFRAQVATADALIIASPEYAHGITGAIKNGLDWLVSFEPFTFKPIGVLNASSRAHHADDSLREILKTMNAILVESASVTIGLVGSGLDENGMVGTPAVADAIRGCLLNLYDSVLQQRS